MRATAWPLWCSLASAVVFAQFAFPTTYLRKINKSNRTAHQTATMVIQYSNCDISDRPELLAAMPQLGHRSASAQIARPQEVHFDRSTGAYLVY